MITIVKIYYQLEDEDYKKIVDYMKKNKLPYRKIAKDLGVSSTYVWDMLSKRRAISKKLIDYFENKGIEFTWHN